MPAKPWVIFRQPEPKRVYLVLLTALPLKHWRNLGAFLLYMWRIHGQLRRTPGLLGYSLLAYILQRQFWTLSVWEDEAALRQFATAYPHSYVMQALQGKMGQMHFVRWPMLGAEFPPSWQEAFGRQATAS